MKTELTDIFEDGEVRRALYRSTVNLSQELDECIRDCRAVESKIGLKTRWFKSRKERPEVVLASYGPSEVIVEYLCDNYARWEGGLIVRALVRDGAQAQRLLEYCLNNYGGMSGTPFQRSSSFADMPFQVHESQEGRRTLNLKTGADHPHILWREMYLIFVDELNGRDTTLADKPAKWYEGLLRGLT